MNDSSQIALQALLFIAGAAIGATPLWLVNRIFLKNAKMMDRLDFFASHPEKKWAHKAYGGFWSIWLVLLALLLGYFIRITPNNDNVLRYFVPCFFATGFGIYNGLFEIVTTISPLKRVGLMATKYIYDPKIRRIGTIRVVSAFAILAVSVLVANLFL